MNVTSPIQQVRNDVKKMLKQFDTNKNKTISFTELVSHLEKTDSKNAIDTANVMFMILDSDNDGMIDVSELATQSESFDDPRVQDRIKSETARLLKFFDKNQDGQVNREEALQAFSKSKNPEIQVDRLFATYDRDHNNIITIEEIRRGKFLETFGGK
ncbi:calcium-binding protein [Cavenderia fasciculata]|uniref:Calcium-binding protein n=1 Tax=Cavenderia fasciculata TaxID=261658 RepID=F4Q1D6_CACFS|nr:calcium-binding protein [Cavenderia fasciculata]EGG18637.1 calcium-binding protein [Cavenderia fasciculata]|eukprot:XP_004366541.1 calcium-binding protein [Cavenderia fasciculata]